MFFVIKSMYTYKITIISDGGTVFGEALQSDYEYKFLERENSIK